MGRELELIADTFAEEPLDLEALLGSINQYYSSLGKTTISNLDDVSPEHATTSLGRILGFGKCKRKQMQDRLVEIEVFSELISEYDDDLHEKIMKNVLNPDTIGFKSFYVSKRLETSKRNENIRIIFSTLFKSEGINNQDDITGATRYKYRSFFNQICDRDSRTLNAIKSWAIHFGFFLDDVERKYSPVKQDGTAVNLLKKLDSELFGFDDISYNEDKVDKISFAMFKGIYSRGEALGVKSKCALDLFDWYHREILKPAERQKSAKKRERKYFQQVKRKEDRDHELNPESLFYAVSEQDFYDIYYIFRAFCYPIEEYNLKPWGC